MKKQFLFISLALALLCGLVPAAAQQLPADPVVRKGKLANGLTYYIARNTQTPKVADFYIAQRVGSILEEPRQRGLAHFLEHMAFNGSRHFPGGDKGPTIVKWCESVGIKFGQNLNAYTSVDQTVYNISAAPVSRKGVADTCLLILSDWSHDLLLTDKEIDKERGVIREEWRTRRAGMAMQRMMENATPVMYKGSKYEDCLPIGSLDIINNFPYKDLRDYYHKWYRPDLQAIIVVGDIDVDKVEAQVKSLFGKIPAAHNPAERVYYPVPDNSKMIVFTETDKEQPTYNFTLYMKRDAAPRDQRNTEPEYAGSYKGSLIRAMLNDRLKEITSQPNPPFVSASARDGSFFLASTKDAFSASGMLKPENVLGGVSAIVAETERARRHGFTEGELSRAKAEVLRRAQSKYDNREKRTNAQIVGLCVRNFVGSEQMMSPEDELQLVKKLDSATTLADVNAAVKELITDNNQVATIYGPKKEGFKMPANAEIEQAILAAQAKDYAAYQDKALPKSLMPQTPKPGSILSEKSAAHGYTLLNLSNGMKVYVRSTNFEPDVVRMKLFSPGGRSLYPDADMPNMAYLASTISESGVGSFDKLTLDKMLAGKTVRVMPSVGDETEGISGVSDRAAMKTMFELANLYFTSPRRDGKAFESLMNRQRSFLKNRNASPMVAYNDSVKAILYGNNPRLKPITEESLGHVSLDRIMQIYKERFANAADFTMILTGSIDLDSLRPLLCTYIASLPAKGAKEQVADDNVRIRPVAETHVFEKEQATPSAMTNIFVSAKMPYTADNDLKLDALCQLLRMEYTEKVREEKGGTYGVSVNGEFQRYPDEECIMKISFRTDPAKYKELTPIVYAQLEEMADKGPAQANLDKVKEFEAKTYGQAEVINDYWQYIMYNDLFNGVDMDKDYVKRVKALTTNSIRDFAKKILEQKRSIEVTMTTPK